MGKDHIVAAAQGMSPGSIRKYSAAVSGKRFPIFKGKTMTDSFGAWLDEVRSALESINMPMEDWQNVWPFNFADEYEAGTKPADAADKANRFWWHQQNKSLGQNCLLKPHCWLPRGHQGECQHV